MGSKLGQDASVVKKIWESVGNFFPNFVNRHNLLGGGIYTTMKKIILA